MQHPDEGTIHAWLDGALGAEERARLEAHVASCPQCADAVAEARGLIAGASRILDALDGVPAGVIPAERGVVPIRQPRGGERRGWFRLTPARMAAAAVLVAAVGTVYTVTQVAPRTEMSVSVERATASMDTMGPAGGAGPSAPQATPSPMAAQSTAQSMATTPAAAAPAAPPTAPLAAPLARRQAPTASKSVATANEPPAVRDADIAVRSRESFAAPAVSAAPVVGRGSGVAGGIAKGVVGGQAADASSGAGADSMSRVRAETALLAGCYAMVPDDETLRLESVVVTGAEPERRRAAEPARPPAAMPVRPPSAAAAPAATDAAKRAAPSRVMTMVPSRIILDTAPSELSEGARVVTGTASDGSTVRGFWRLTGSGTARVTWLTRERPTLDLTLRADTVRAIVAGDSSLTVRLRRCP